MYRKVDIYIHNTVSCLVPIICGDTPQLVIVFMIGCPMLPAYNHLHLMPIYTCILTLGILLGILLTLGILLGILVSRYLTWYLGI